MELAGFQIRKGRGPLPDISEGVGQGWGPYTTWLAGGKEAGWGRSGRTFLPVPMHHEIESPPTTYVVGN